MSKNSDEEVGRVGSRGVDIIVRRRHLEKLSAFLGRLLGQTSKAPLFKAISIDRDPTDELLDQTLECLRRSRDVVFASLADKIPGLQLSHLRANIFRFVFDEEDVPVFGRLVPVEDAQINFMEREKDTRTVWTIGEGAAASIAFSRGKVWCKNADDLDKQGEEILHYSERVNQNLKWVIAVPFRAIDGTRMGVLCIDSEFGTVRLNDLKAAGKEVHLHGLNLGKLWGRLPQTSVFIGVETR